MLNDLLEKIRSFADAQNIKPSTVLQRAIGAGGAEWQDWVDGSSSPTVRRAERVLKYIDDANAAIGIAPDIPKNCNEEDAA